MIMRENQQTCRGTEETSGSYLIMRVILSDVDKLFQFAVMHEERSVRRTSPSTHIGGLSDEPLLRVEDVFDASDQLQRTSVIRALKVKEHMCCVKSC